MKFFCHLPMLFIWNSTQRLINKTACKEYLVVKCTCVVDCNVDFLLNSVGIRNCKQMRLIHFRTSIERTRCVSHLSRLTLRYMLCGQNQMEKPMCRPCFFFSFSLCLCLFLFINCCCWSCFIAILLPPLNAYTAAFINEYECLCEMTFIHFR